MKDIWYSVNEEPLDDDVDSSGNVVVLFKDSSMGIMSPSQFFELELEKKPTHWRPAYLPGLYE